MGCSIGALSVAALFIDSDAEVIAIDSASLLATKEMCSRSSGDWLILLHGLVSNEPSVSFTVARERTRNLLSSITLKEAYKFRYDYICLIAPTQMIFPVCASMIFFRIEPHDRCC